ncbi:hypothetical protein EON65_51510 [archaeon]|nr:MAG: hypothetical protein EON65_51510 [archaeon]
MLTPGKERHLSPKLDPSISGRVNAGSIASRCVAVRDPTQNFIALEGSRCRAINEGGYFVSSRKALAL